VDVPGTTYRFDIPFPPEAHQYSANPHKTGEIRQNNGALAGDRRVKNDETIRACCLKNNRILLFWKFLID